MNILYQDAALAVVLKPAGMLSQADNKGTASAVSVLSEKIGPVFAVHRLDRTTQGLMVFAKTPAAAANLSRQIAEGNMKKVYLAAVHGAPSEPSGRMEDLLFYDRKKNKSYVAQHSRNGVKKAVLHYKTLQSAGEISLLEIILETGRTHQIRVQCAARGMPLLGDGRYGARDGFASPALFAAALSFRHPQTGEVLHFSADRQQLNGFFVPFSLPFSISF